jgi:dolichol kinase
LKEEEQTQPTGSTLLLLASLLIFLFSEKDIAITSLLSVAIGDPVASNIGSRFGKHFMGKKTLEGSLACLFSCLVVGLSISRLSLTMSPLVASYGAIYATLVEALPIDADDNFTMPLLSAIAMTVAQHYFV